MLSADESQVWDDLVQKEWTDPSPRKVAPDRVIYSSCSPGIPDDGNPVICDFGEARVGSGPFTGEVMPDLYRAPESILYIPWTRQIDIWSMGLLVSTPLQIRNSICKSHATGVLTNSPGLGSSRG